MQENSPSPDIYDASFRIPSSKEKAKERTRELLRRPGKNSFFEEPEYDFAREKIQTFLEGTADKIAELLIEKTSSGQIFSSTELDTLAQTLDAELSEVIEQEHLQVIGKEAENVEIEEAEISQITKRLIASGLLKYDIRNLRVEGGKVKGEIVTPGNELKRTLESYNDIYMTALVSQGLEAGESKTSVIDSLSDRYPEYPRERLAVVADEVEKRMTLKEDSISDARLYWLLIKKLTGRHKLQIAEITALSALASASNLFSVEALTQGIKSADIRPLIGGFVLAGLQSTLNTVRTREVQKLIAGFMEGNEGYEGLKNEVLRSIIDLTPEITEINASSLAINNPYDLEKQTYRLQKAAESFPANLIPSLIDFTSASLFLSSRDPSWATAILPLVYGGYLIYQERQRAQTQAKLEKAKRRIEGATTVITTDLQTAASLGAKIADPQRIREAIKQRRNLAAETINTEQRHRLQKIAPFAVLGLAQTALSLMEGHVDPTALVPLVNAQKNETEALDRLGGSYLGIKPLLAPLCDLYNEITAAQTRREKKAIPQTHDLSFQRVELRSAREEPYLQIENLKIFPGDTVLLEGPSGAGKSAFFQLLYGKRPDSGLMTIGRHTLWETNLRSYREQIGLKPQEPITINGSLGVNLGGAGFNEALAAKILVSSGLDESLFGQDYAAITDETLQQAYIKSQLDTLQLAGSTAKAPGSRDLSKGQRQLLALLRIEYQLRSGADIKTIALDEPLAGLDTQSTEHALRLIEQWIDESKKTVIVATHNERLKQLLSEKKARKIRVEKGKIFESEH
ncbi:hypothetical protein B5M47_00430 [candidate division CPR3 bacterium 4484_211]|uniref:ABC transporter domain-containing protein n=1 Tax=candidate division CPR3 bacterium 4484_211 TaxID=1968527 RepID=A0A1W9NZ88_UNCC3|nr:MAG: hypothetical protein B5M47_00430 [candidate division CPR3 bacterium 4484_211]